MIHVNKIKYGFEGKDHTGKKLFNVQLKNGLCSMLNYFENNGIDIEIRYHPSLKELKFSQQESSKKLIFESPTETYIEGTRNKTDFSYTTKKSTIEG